LKKGIGLVDDGLGEWHVFSIALGGQRLSLNPAKAQPQPDFFMIPYDPLEHSSSNLEILLILAQKSSSKVTR
jgi:hypothetical protein